MSRILARFEDDGLVTRSRARGDARKQVISLTRTGRAAFKTLDQQSATEIKEQVARLKEKALASYGVLDGSLLIRPETSLYRIQQ